VTEKFVPVSIEIAYSGRRARRGREVHPREAEAALVERLDRRDAERDNPQRGAVLWTRSARGLEKWNELPEADRKPGLALDDLGSADPALDLAPPAGGLVLNVFIRSLDRTRAASCRADEDRPDNAGAAPIDARRSATISGSRRGGRVDSNQKRSRRRSCRPPCRFYLKDSATASRDVRVQYGGYTGTMTRSCRRRRSISRIGEGQRPRIQLAGGSSSTRRRRSSRGST
jgi:hypothetical protein